ncbi:MAG: hypothetical protein M3R01_06815 [Actinomycetota bacterium]|nr:hypothetical protein [Actinomycetota bacterium]
MACQTGYICVTVPPDVEPLTIVRETDEVSPVTLPSLASTGMDVIGYSALGISMVAAGLVLRWNARKLANGAVHTEAAS